MKKRFLFLPFSFVLAISALAMTACDSSNSVRGPEEFPDGALSSDSLYSPL